MSDQQTIANPPKVKASPPVKPEPAPRNRLPIILLGLLVLAGAGYFIWSRFFAAPELPKGIIAVSGRIEGDDSAVAAKTSGRIKEVRLREGDEVKAGDIIAILDDDQIRAREEQSQSAVRQAEAQVRFAREQVSILNEQLRETGLQVDQARQQSSGQVRQAEAELSAAEANLAQQEAAYKLALFDKEAYTKLAKSGAVSERQGRQAETSAETQAAVVASARRRVEAARAAVSSAKSSLVTPEIRSAQGSMVRQQIAQQQSQIASAEAQLAQARAGLEEAQANRRDLMVLAPFAGTIATRTAEPGEVATPGAPIVTLLDLSKVYLRGFIPEGQIGRVRIGQPARIYLDSDPTKPIEAVVSRIDPQATFTPENTYFRDDRVKQVVGVKLQLKGAVGYAKPGMPADAEVLVEGDRWSESTRKP
ncbi:MAG TPA: HlyD family efflux transporter periplasmic adaptor subunit [Bryobacteraceae bacterium]|nr:HlyD family efflux transporter periplasmic adaptor subunit [Bryobacteraceae bacterium]